MSDWREGCLRLRVCVTAEILEILVKSIIPPSTVPRSPLIRDKTPRERIVFSKRSSLFKMNHWISLASIRNFANMPSLLNLFAVWTVVSVEIPDGGFNESLR